jgi:hypothetical protein
MAWRAMSFHLRRGRMPDVAIAFICSQCWQSLTCPHYRKKDLAAAGARGARL